MVSDANILFQVTHVLPPPTHSSCEQLQGSLGLGTWSYIGLGLSLMIILLNNTLGLGWLGRLVTPDFDTEGMTNIENQRPGQVQVLPLDDTSNLLR